MKKFSLAPSTRVRWILFAAAGCCLLPAAEAASYPETVLADNPAVYYRFEDAADATSITNAVAPDLHAGEIWFDDAYEYPQLQQGGIESHSIKFHAYTPEGGFEQRSFVEVPYAEELNPSGSYTIELWARSASWGNVNRCVVGNLADFSTGWWLRQEAGESARWLFVQNGGGIYMAGGPIASKEWTHLVVTYDGTTVRFYANGVQTWTETGKTPSVNTSGPLRIGGNTANGDGFFDGNVDELAIYATALSAEQIQLHYEVGRTNITSSEVAPSISADPKATSTYSGRVATFSVTADGSLPLSYQWYKNSEPIAGATADVLNYTCSYDADNQAEFTVTVTNPHGAATSGSGILTVLTDLVLDASPESVVRNVGSKAAFGVTAGGALPVSYQWYEGNDPLVGETNRVLWLDNLQLADDQKTFYVKLTNPWGTLDSDVAHLTVWPRMTPQPNTGYARIVLQDDPVAYWRLNETEGSFTAVDSAGSFDGEYNADLGPITYGVAPGIPGESDPAISVADKAEVRVPWALELNPPGPFSVEVWFNAASSSEADYRNVITSMGLGVGGTGPNGWLFYQQPGDTLAWVLFSKGWNANWLVGGGPIQVGSWNHATLTYDGTVFRSYLNGQFAAETTYDAFIPNGDGYASFGHRFSDSGKPFDGSLDDIAFYNRVLTPDQIAGHYYATIKLGVSRSGNELILSWPFGTLQQADRADGEYTDLSGATSPYTAPMSGTAKFYRVKVQ